jgi:hypothetical protein
MNIIKSIIKLFKSLFTTQKQKTYFYSYNTDKNVNTVIQLDPILKKAEDQKLPKIYNDKEVTTTVLLEPVLLPKKKGRKPSNKKK